MQLLDEHITENIVKVETRPSPICSIPDRDPALDWGPVLSASRWDPTGISLVLVTLFLLLWRSGAPQVQIQRRSRECRLFLSRTIPARLNH